MRRARKSPLVPPLAAAALAALVAFFALAGTALADDTYKVTPQVSARETYDSNVHFLGKADFETSLTPGVRVEMNKDRLSGWAQARATAFKYARLNKYDRVDQMYEAGMQLNATETVSFDVKGGITADHAYTSALTETGQLGKSASHQQYTFQPSTTIALTENNSLTLLYNFSKTVYDTKEYTDNLSHTLAGVWGYRLTERLQLLTQLADTRMENDSADYNSYSLMGGFEYTLAETLKARVLLGGSSTHATPKVGEKRSFTSYSADTNLDWKLERANVSAGYARDVTMGVYGDDRLRDRFTLNFGYNITERFKGLFAGNAVFTKDQQSTASSQSSRWYELNPSLEYMLGEKTSLTGGYAYGLSKDTAADTLHNRSRVYLNFNTSF